MRGRTRAITLENAHRHIVERDNRRWADGDGGWKMATLDEDVKYSRISEDIRLKGNEGW